MFLILFLLALGIGSFPSCAGNVQTFTPMQPSNPEQEAQRKQAQKEKEQREKKEQEEKAKKKASKEKADKEHKQKICLEACKEKAKDLPACHDSACKEDNMQKTKACEDACGPKPADTLKSSSTPESGNHSPCVSQCISSAQTQEPQCAGNTTCLDNLKTQFSSCVQNCNKGGPTAGAGAMSM
jgi:hypothetical protein